jgi:predicted porin
MNAVVTKSVAMRAHSQRLIKIGVASCFAAATAATPVFADSAQDIQTLKDQVRILQQKLDSMSSSQTAKPETTGTVAAPAQTNAGTQATDERKRRETPALTYAGITLYGTVDLNVAYITHGAPISSTWGPGLPSFIQNYSNKSVVALGGNGLSQSKVGLSGVEPLGFQDFNGVFRLETGFNPWSGRLVDAAASLVADNGKTAPNKIASGDSSREGQPFQGAAYAGVSSKTYGTLTFGRQNGLELDNLVKYDPQLQSQAFSPIGLSGNAAGLGNTESARLDNSLKYVYQYGPARASFIHAFGNDGYVPQNSNEFDVGADMAGFSADVFWGHVNGAVSLASLTAAQLALPGVASNSLSATISDNTSYAANISYNMKEYFPIKFYAGWERVKYANPKHTDPAGTVGLGGYVFSIVNNTAFTINRILQYSWFGARWSATPQFDLTAAYYQYNQKSNAANGCSDTSAGTCAGELHDASLVADYHWTGRFDTYAGVNYSLVQDGLASGFLFKNEFSPAIGVRFNF